MGIKKETFFKCLERKNDILHNFAEIFAKLALLSTLRTNFIG